MAQKKYLPIFLSASDNYESKYMPTESQHFCLLTTMIFKDLFSATLAYLLPTQRQEIVAVSNNFNIIQK